MFLVFTGNFDFTGNELWIFIHIEFKRQKIYEFEKHFWTNFSWNKSNSILICQRNIEFYFLNLCDPDKKMYQHYTCWNFKNNNFILFGLYIGNREHVIFCIYVSNFDKLFFIKYDQNSTYCCWWNFLRYIFRTQTFL